MAKMLARDDRRQQSQRHHRQCRCDKSALYFSPGGAKKIRRRNRAREKRQWTRDENN